MTAGKTKRRRTKAQRERIRVRKTQRQQRKSSTFIVSQGFTLHRQVRDINIKHIKEAYGSGKEQGDRDKSTKRKNWRKVQRKLKSNQCTLCLEAIIDCNKMKDTNIKCLKAAYDTEKGKCGGRSINKREGDRKKYKENKQKVVIA